MDELKHKIGTVVKNDGKDLARALGIYDAGSVRHTGNFCFEASYSGIAITITTEPQDDEYELIKITDIRIHPNQVRKAAITYRMIRGHETAESFIDLPISQARYEQLAKGITARNEVWHEVRDALERLAFLQGYEELGSWSVELKIET